MIFGEGIVNDIVCIILFQTSLNLQETEFTSQTILTVLTQFLLLGVCSLLIGLFFGFFTSYLFKHAKFLRVNAITETFVILSFSYMSYFLSEIIVVYGIRLSGIIALITSGVV